MRTECDSRMTIMAIQKYQANNRACITCIRDPRILIVSQIKAAQKKYLLSGLNDLKPRSLRCQRMVCTSTFKKNHSPILPVNLIVRKMTSQLSADFDKVWSPPPSLLCSLSAYLQTRALFYSHLPNQNEEEGRAPTVQAVRLQAYRRDWCQKRKKDNLTLNWINIVLACIEQERNGIIHYCKTYFLGSWACGLSNLSILAIPPLHPRSRRRTCKHIS